MLTPKADFEHDYFLDLADEDLQDDEDDDDFLGKEDEDEDDGADDDSESPAGSQAEEKSLSAGESDDDPDIDQSEMKQAIMRDSLPGRKKGLHFHNQSLERTEVDNKFVAEMDDKELSSYTVRDAPGGRYDLVEVQDDDNVPGEIVDLKEIEPGVYYDPKTKEKITPTKYKPPVPIEGQPLPPSLRGKAYKAKKVSAAEAKLLEAAAKRAAAKGGKAKGGKTKGGDV